MFESRDYDQNMLRSSQEAALKLLKHIADSPLAHLLDHKVVIREVLGSLTNKQNFVVQVESLNILRLVLSNKKTFPVSIGFLTLLMGDKMFKKLNSLHNFLLRGSSNKSNETNETKLNETNSNETKSNTTTKPKKRGKKNWMKAIRSTTSSVESIGGTKIVSTEAALRHFLTTELDVDTVAGLHIGLRKMGWMDQSTVDGPSVDATTSSLIVGNKLKGKFLTRRRKKQKEKTKKEDNNNNNNNVQNSGGIRQPGSSRYHDEGVIHLPIDSSTTFTQKQNTIQTSNKSKSNAAGNVRTRLKMAQLKKTIKKKGSLGMIASLVGGENNFFKSTTIQKSKPVVAHLKFRPLGFASFNDEKNMTKNNSSSNDDEDHDAKQRENEKQDAESMLESVTKDEHSFTQSCANRHVITFNSRMSAGADRVMSIEADEASEVAADLLKQIEIAESREDTDQAKIGKSTNNENKPENRPENRSYTATMQKFTLVLFLFVNDSRNPYLSVFNLIIQF